MAVDRKEAFAVVLVDYLQTHHLTIGIIDKPPDGFWDGLADALNAVGSRTTHGTPWQSRNCRAYWKNHRNELILGMLSRSKDEYYLTRKEFRAEVEKLKALIEGGQSIQASTGNHPALPPGAPKRGKKKVGERCKIASTIDQALMRRIEAEMQERGVTLSTMLDTAFWHYFSKPSLSFEEQ